jgi:hypothetical protein
LKLRAVSGRAVEDLATELRRAAERRALRVIVENGNGMVEI